MHATVRRKLLRVLLLHRACSSLFTPSTAVASLSWRTTLPGAPASFLPPTSDILHMPWSVIQRRGAKVLGTDVRRGFIIQRRGRIFQVLEAQHTQQGRGGAIIKVELRDIDSGNKISDRFRTDDAIERVLVEERSFSFLYQDGDSIFLMDPETFEQMEISKELLGKAAVYLQDNMTVSLQIYDGKVMSASIPRRVTCKVTEAQPYSKGQQATPQAEGGRTESYWKERLIIFRDIKEYYWTTELQFWHLHISKLVKRWLLILQLMLMLHGTNSI